MALDTTTRQQLLKDARIGDLSFNRSDRSLWGIRTFNGICTLVGSSRTELECYFPAMGKRSRPRRLAGRRSGVRVGQGEIGRQSVRIMKTASLMSGDATPDKQFDFGTAALQLRVLVDGKYLFGSSYYTGVSNIFRYELATGEIEALTNAETGFFRPVPLDNGSLLVFRYTGDGSSRRSSTPP